MFMVICNVGKIDPFDVDALMGGDSEDFNFGELKKGSHVAFLISPQLPIEELGAVMPVELGWADAAWEGRTARLSNMSLARSTVCSSI
jgi:hypothetical protein